MRYDIWLKVKQSAQPLMLMGDVTPLLPYTAYAIAVDVCTGGGCTRSLPVTVTTLADTPRGLAAPVISEVGPYSVTLSWLPPVSPNGPNIRWGVNHCVIS